MENEQTPRQWPAEFTSRLSKWETFAVLVYIPVHIIALPTLLYIFYAKGYITEVQTNFIVYAVGALYMLVFAFRFLRRDFDPLCDNFGRCLSEVCRGELYIIASNMVTGIALTLLFSNEQNPNNSEIVSLYTENSGMIFAMAVLLGPIPEELMFRAGIFGTIRRHSRIWAYAVCAVLFGLYHVWSYAAVNPLYLVYIVQYIPISIIICRCYERTNTIWASIFLHMLSNAIGFAMLAGV